VDGIVLLVALVPARRVIFNTDGRLLALTVLAVAGVAAYYWFAAQVGLGGLGPGGADGLERPDRGVHAHAHLVRARALRRSGPVMAARVWGSPPRASAS